MIEEEPPKDDATATAAAAPAPIPFNPILEIEPGNADAVLVLQDDGLHLLGGTGYVTPDPKCAFLTRRRWPPPEQVIPYYHILWASLPNPEEELGPANTLSINYAVKVSKKRLEAANITFNLQGLTADRRLAVNTWIESLLLLSYGTARRSKRAYVIINPHAGRGHADHIYQNDVHPLFLAANMGVQVAHTVERDHAKTLAQELDVNSFDTVVACSGDGLPNEVFNGLGSRPDAGHALANLAVCQIPCGSGNAMARNLAGTCNPSHVALAIIKGLPTRLDLISVTYGNRRDLSFLSQALGIVADVDLGTEWMRWMGEERFILGFLWLVLVKKLYPCDIAVKVEIEKDRVKAHYRDHAERPAEGYADDEGGQDGEAQIQENDGNNQDPAEARGDGDNGGSPASGQSNDQMLPAGDASRRPASGQSDDQMLPVGDASRRPASGQSDDQVRLMGGDSPSPAHGQSEGRTERAAGGNDGDNGADPEAKVPDAEENQGLPPLRFGTVQSQIPDDWEIVTHSNLGNFYCGNMRWMTSDAPFFSAALPNDGLMDLILINGDIHRTTAIGLQLSLESGKFFDNPHVSYRKVSAFRVTPHNLPGQGNISIDGERLAFQPFQAEVHRGLGLTLSKNNRLFDGDGPIDWEEA